MKFPKDTERNKGNMWFLKIWYWCHNNKVLHFFYFLDLGHMRSVYINCNRLLNFHVSYYLRLFMMSFKFGLFLLRYYAIDSVSFLSPLLLYSI